MQSLSRYLVITTVLGGCAAHPPIPVAPDIAVVRSKIETVPIAGTRAILLVAVDGKESEREVRLQPGEHVVSVTYNKAGGPLFGRRVIAGLTEEQLCHVTLQAEAGHEYFAEARNSKKYYWTCWLEDVATKKKTWGVRNVPAEKEERVVTTPGLERGRPSLR